MSVGRLIYLKSWVDENILDQPLRKLGAANADDLTGRFMKDAKAMGFAVDDIEADVGGDLGAFIAEALERKRKEKGVRAGERKRES